MNNPFDKALHFPATLRNRNAIAEVLKEYLPETGVVLEIGSGSGEHGTFFANIFSNLDWQLSDNDPVNLDSIRAWIYYELPDKLNIYPPLLIDVSNIPLPVKFANVIICINVVHITPWNVTEGLMKNAGVLLPKGGTLYLYGPYKVSGKHTSPSNELFDLSLRAENEKWGVRDMESICAEAKKNNLKFIERVKMPSNNQSLIFCKDV